VGTRFPHLVHQADPAHATNPGCAARYNRGSVRSARRFLISGRVQGVGFRYFAEAAAAREGLHGWVRNLPDGRVEASAEGDAQALDRFERAIRHGPPGARVDHVDVDHTAPTGRDTGFSVS
jgi:acylphosphatase